MVYEWEKDKLASTSTVRPSIGPFARVAVIVFTFLFEGLTPFVYYQSHELNVPASLPTELHAASQLIRLDGLCAHLRYHFHNLSFSSSTQRRPKAIIQRGSQHDDRWSASLFWSFFSVFVFTKVNCSRRMLKFHSCTDGAAWHFLCLGRMKCFNCISLHHISLLIRFIVSRPPITFTGQRHPMA